jgi:dihydroxyacetone kinase-like predicted kinase
MNNGLDDYQDLIHSIDPEKIFSIGFETGSKEFKNVVLENIDEEIENALKAENANAIRFFKIIKRKIMGLTID